MFCSHVIVGVLQSCDCWRVLVGGKGVEHAVGDSLIVINLLLLLF